MSEVMPAEKLRVCVAHSGRGSYFEAYIRAHIERLSCETIELYGGLPPVFHDKRRLLSASFPAKVWRRLAVAIMRWPKDHFQVRAIARFLKRKKVDVVLAEYGETAAHLLDACVEADVPLVAYFHGGDAYRLNTLERFARRYRRLFREAETIVVVSTDLQKKLISLGAPPEKIIYNPCAVDRSRFAGARPACAPPIFLAVGRFVEKKAPDLTLFAFKKTLDVCPEARLVMIGDGPLYEQCREAVVAYGIAGSVDFRGGCTHEAVAEAMRGARVFVQHSIQAPNGDAEGTPVAVLEAAASGLPVVATTHMGIKDVVEPGETGYLVAEGDVDAMAERMILLARDPELAGCLGKNARQRLPERYDMEKNIQVLHDILRVAATREATKAAQDLFFALRAPHPDTGAAVRARAASPGIVDRAATLALEYGFGGIFYRNVESAGLEDLLSPEAHEKLRRVRAGTMRSGLAWIQKFVDISSALAEKGLRCVPLKGTSLSMRTYPDEGCRATADLDILIDPESFSECARVLRERGYRVQAQALRGVLQNHGQECTFIGLDGDEVDVHYRLFPWYAEKYIYKIDSAAMRSRIERHAWAQGEVFFLKREDELHYLFLCAAESGGFKYRLDADVFTRVHGAELDWGRVGAALFDSPMRKIHGATAAFMAERLQTPFPALFAERAAAFRAGGVASKLGAANLFDRAALTGLYLRWNIFKRTGLFRRYFLEHNNPFPAEFS